MQTVSTGPEHDHDPFEQARPRLRSLAYRLLGSVADAEDILQEAHLRWWQLDDGGRAAIVTPTAWLTRVVTNLALDHLGSARVRRERYVGPWLPEPFADDGAAGPADVLGVSMAMMLVLERLSPLERAVLVLSECFGHTPQELSELLARTPAAIRQLLHRAREHLGEDRARFVVDADQHLQLLGAFFAAMQQGDVAAIEGLLREDVRAHSDGGGKVHAALKVLHGRDRVARFFIGIAPRGTPTTTYSVQTLNGQPAIVGVDDGRVVLVAMAEAVDGALQQLFVVVNPEKLAHLAVG